MVKVDNAHELLVGSPLLATQASSSEWVFFERSCPKLSSSSSLIHDDMCGSCSSNPDAGLGPVHVIVCPQSQIIFMFCLPAHEPRIELALYRFRYVPAPPVTDEMQLVHVARVADGAELPMLVRWQQGEDCTLPHTAHCAPGLTHCPVLPWHSKPAIRERSQ